MDLNSAPQPQEAEERPMSKVQRKVANYFQGAYGQPDPSFDPTNPAHIQWLMSLGDPEQQKIQREREEAQRRQVERQGAGRNWNGGEFGREFGGEHGGEYGKEFGGEFGREFGGEHGFEFGDGQADREKDFDLGRS